MSEMNVIPTGAAMVRAHLAQFLSEAMPPLIMAARQQYGFADHLLPMPLSYKAYDPLSIKNYPSLGSYVTQSRRWTRVDVNAMGENVYEAVYAIRAFVWVRTPQTPEGVWIEPTYDTALDLRDRMLALMRSAMLATPSLGSNGKIALQEDTMTEDYLDGIKSNDQSPRWMVGGIVNIDAKVQESNYLLPLASANRVVVEAGPMIQEVTP